MPLNKRLLTTGALASQVSDFSRLHRDYIVVAYHRKQLFPRNLCLDPPAQELQRDPYPTPPLPRVGYHLS
jgi:hypothetical protein